MSIKLNSYAKLNLALSINYKRIDGYHDISSIIQEIDFHDTLEISKNDLNQINIISKGVKVPEDQSNLCYIAAKLFLNYYNISDGVNIIINKNIPIGAGLGGGSSNASYTLKGLYKLFNIKISDNIFYQFCSLIGADVSFFYNGGTQYVEGIGDKVTSLPPLFRDYYFLLIFPSINISTPWAYGEYKKYLENNLNEPKFLALTSDMSINWSLLRNDFEKVVLSTYPEIKRIKSGLQKTQSLFSTLSGSGSTMFGVYDNLESVKMANNLFKDFQTYISLPIN